MTEVNNEEIKFDIKNRKFYLKKSDFQDKKELFLFDYFTDNPSNKFFKTEAKQVSINLLDQEEGTKGTITQKDINIFLDDKKIKKKGITQQDIVSFIDKLYKFNPTPDEKVLNQVVEYKDETGKTIMTPELKEVFGFEYQEVSNKITDNNGNVKKGMEIFDLNNDGEIDAVEKEYQSKNNINVFSNIHDLNTYLNNLNNNSVNSENSDYIITNEEKQKAYDRTKAELLAKNLEKLENVVLKDENGNNIVTPEIKTLFENNEQIEFKDIIDNNGNVKKGFEIFDLNGNGNIDNQEKGYFSASGHYNNTKKSVESVNLSEFLSSLTELDNVGYDKSVDNNTKNKTITTQDKKDLYKILESGIYMLENMKDFPTELQQDYAKALKEQCLYDNKRKYSVGTHVGNIITIDTAAISKPEIASILTHELTHALLDDKMPALQQEVVTFFMEYKLYSEAKKNDPDYFKKVNRSTSSGIKTIVIDKDYMNFIDNMKKEHPEMKEKDIAVEAFLKYKFESYNGRYQEKVSEDYMRNLDYSVADKFFKNN